MSATITPPAAAAVRRPRRRLRFARDDELVRLLRAGDASAFEAIFDRHHRGILAFARHMVGSREEAEDVVQHTFIAAHRDLEGSSKPIQLKAWLYTIARNRCLSLLRAHKEERALDDVPEPSVEGLAVQVQRRQDLRDMVADLQGLPEEQRAALVLSELGALTHEEVAETLGVRKDKVKALVFQARESLASSRTAREADCREIQEQLAVLRGGSLRRTTLRRHVEVCPACAAFKAEVQRQRKALAVILPVAPTLALKDAVIGAGIAAGGGGAAAISGGTGAGVAGGGLLAAVGSKSLAAKVLTIAAVAGGATGGGIMAVDEISTAPDQGVALGGVPPEQQSVQMVGDLRERAREAATQREADRGATVAASGGTDRPARSIPAMRRPLQVASAGRARAVAVAGRPRSTQQRAAKRRADRLAVASPREAAPTPAPAAPAVAAAPPTEVGPEIERGKAGNDNGNGEGVRTAAGGPKPGRGWRKKEGHSKPPAIELPAAANRRKQDAKPGGQVAGARGPWRKPKHEAKGGRPPGPVPGLPGKNPKAHEGKWHGGQVDAKGPAGAPAVPGNGAKERAGQAAEQAKAALARILGAILPR